MLLPIDLLWEWLEEPAFPFEAVLHAIWRWDSGKEQRAVLTVRPFGS